MSRKPRLAVAVLLSAIGAAVLSPSVLAADPCAFKADREVVVASASALSSALAQATPGTRIRLQPGVYAGRFRITASGTAEKRIILCGPREAILDGGSTSTGYVLHLSGASYWKVSGFTVRRGKNGVMLDRASKNYLLGLLIHTVGQSGVHFRTYSSSNYLRYSEVRDTGLLDPGYGEGVYVGTAVSNWPTITGSSSTPDRSDYNRIEYNVIGPNVAAEPIDIKEGTRNGRVIGNVFDGTGMTGANYADSWIDVKGNGWLIADNTGSNTLRDGYQTHVAVAGWGNNNTFVNNLSAVNGPGLGFAVAKNSSGNVVRCDNRVTNAASGFANVACAP